MARRRFISNGLWTNGKFTRCNKTVRLAYIGVVGFADDEGRLKDDPRQLRLLIFPADSDISDKKFDAILEQLSEVGLILRYCSGDENFIEIPKWAEHQDSRYKVPSKIPPAPISLYSNNLADSGGIAGIRQHVNDHEYDQDHVKQIHVRSDERTDADFSEFWKRYPRREGKGKAQESWKSHVTKRKIPLSDILAGIGKWEKSEKWNSTPPIIPLPSTWINQHRWEDDPIQEREPEDDLPEWKPPAP